MDTLRQNRHFVRIRLLITTIISIAIGWVITELQLPHLQEIKQAELKSEDYIKLAEAEKIKLEFTKKFPTCGLDNLISSWSMLSFLQYVGDTNARKHTGYNLSYRFLEIIEKTDPLFAEAYLIISPASSIFGGTPQKTVAIMDEGLKHLTPNIHRAYLIWMYKAVDEILFLGDLKKAKKSYEKAAEWATIAGDKRIAKAAEGTAKFLSTNPDSREAQVGAWFTVWTSNQDKSVRSRAESEIERLGGKLTVYPDGRVEAQPPKIKNS